MNWYKQANSQVSIDMTYYDESIKEQFYRLMDFTNQEAQRLSKFKPDSNFITQSLQRIGYNNPNLPNLINSGNSDALNQEVSQILTFIHDLKSSHDYKQYIDEQKVRDNARKAAYMLWDISSVKEGYNPMTEEDMNASINTLRQQTLTNLQNIAKMVTDAVGRIPRWSGSPVVVHARSVDKENYNQPETDASISIGNAQNSPDFTLFNIDGTYTIDDVIEDDEFLQDPNVKMDYFMLINEIRKPGSSAKEGKILKLYTARPVKDRQLYENATEVPAGIFLTQSLDFAENFGADYNEKRDIWRILINSNHLIETMNSPGQKQYQVIGTGNVPVKSITFISPAN